MKPANQYLMEYAADIKCAADLGLCNVSGLRNPIERWLVRRSLKKIIKAASVIGQYAKDAG